MNTTPKPTSQAGETPRAEETPLEWQPIETAPKDGESVLLFDGERVSYGGWLSEVDQGADYEGQGLIAAGWWSVDLSENKPTHWMPLPDPPKGPTR